MVLKTADRPSLESKFAALVQQWKEACAYLSSTSAMIAHSAYQAIIELGRAGGAAASA